MSAAGSFVALIDDDDAIVGSEVQYGKFCSARRCEPVQNAKTAKTAERRGAEARVGGPLRRPLTQRGDRRENANAVAGDRLCFRADRLVAQARRAGPTRAAVRYPRDAGRDRESRPPLRTSAVFAFSAFKDEFARRNRFTAASCFASPRRRP